MLRVTIYNRVRVPIGKDWLGPLPSSQDDSAAGWSFPGAVPHADAAAGDGGAGAGAGAVRAAARLPRAPPAPALHRVHAPHPLAPN